MPRRPASGGRAGFVGDASAQGMVLGRAPLRSLVRRDAAARAGLVAGLLLGGTGLVRVDALREVVLLLPVLALGAALGGRWVRPCLVGLAASLVVSAVAAVGLSWQYLSSIGASLLPLLVLLVLVGGGSWAALLLWRRGARLPAAVLRRLPDVAAAGVVLTGLYLASRPLWQVARQDPDDPGSRYVAGMQAREGLAVDGGRTYAEQTVGWLAWYVGAVALVVALVVLALVVRRGVRSATRGVVEAWVPALVVAAGSTVLTLLRPGITPDHPWADRRLLVALPLVVVLVVVGLDEVVRRAVAAGRGWGRGHGGRGGGGARRRPRGGGDVAAPGRRRRAGVARCRRPGLRGARPARRRARRRLPGRQRVAAGRARDVRGAGAVDDVRVCARTTPAWPPTVESVAGEVAARGGRLVLLAADSAQALEGLGLPGEPVTDVVVREDEHVLERRPVRTDPLPVRVWLSPVPAG